MAMEIFSRSAELHSAAVASMKDAVPADHPRTIAAYQCALMSVEHAAGALALLTIGMPNAALALFRPQFEALIRSVWLLEAAEEKWVRQYHEAPADASATAANAAPTLAAMREDLLRLDDPRSKDVVEHFDEYRAQAADAIDGLTHGGLHPMSRAGNRDPAGLVDRVVRCANGLVCHAAQMAALVSTDAPSSMVAVHALRAEFQDCLPAPTLAS